MFNLRNKKIKKLIMLLLVCFLLVGNDKAYAEIFQWPVSDFSTSNVTSPMGFRTLEISYGYHAGWDISRGMNEPIYAIASGTVVSAGFDNSMGNYVKIKHVLDTDLIIDGVNYGSVIYSRYMHLNALSPYVTGDTIAGGSQLGVMGTTGTSTGTHLHIDIMNFDGFMPKGSSETEGLGESVVEGGNLILRKFSNPLEAAFSPEIIIGQDLASEIIGASGPSGSGLVGSDGTYISIGDYTKGKIRAGNTTSYMGDGTGITDKTDILTKLEVSGEQIDYGKLAGLESQSIAIQDYLSDFSLVVAAILIFLGTILSGISIILNRNNPEGRMAGLSAVAAVGVGGLIIGCASLLVSFIAGLM